MKDLPRNAEQRKESWRRKKPQNKELNKDKYRRNEKGGKMQNNGQNLSGNQDRFAHQAHPSRTHGTQPPRHQIVINAQHTEYEASDESILISSKR